MSKKNLPIKIFEKRKKIDDRLTEGGGDNSLPKWMKLTQQQLGERAKEFKTTLDVISNELQLRNKKTDFIPAVIELELHELATAKTFRNDVANIFNATEETNFIGYTGERKLLIKINNEDEITQINKKLLQPEKVVRGIESVVEISKYQPRINVRNRNSKMDEPLRVSLLNYNDYHTNEAIASLFEKTCRREEINFKRSNYSPELIVYRLSNVSMDAFETIKIFDAVEAISFMPKYSVVLDDLKSSDVNIDIRKPSKEKNYPIVGVLDSGIKDVPHLKPWLLPNKFSKVPDDIIDPFHGTFVAGIIEYGDQLEGKDYVGNKGCYLFDATVFPGKDEIEEMDLVENIREAIAKNYKEIKIWNLSLGTKKETDINQFSLFGKALDQIQDMYGVLICKSVGNCHNFMSDKPVERIAESADSIRALTIGSVAHEKGKYDKADKFDRSPFSRIGKAPASVNKPELTHFGGNAGINTKTGKLSVTGVRSFGITGGIATNAGTSFSTPRVTSLLAELHNQLAEDFNPLLLKALAIHSAKYPNTLKLPSHEKIKSLGYGIPSKVDDILYNDPHEITLILQDTLTKGNWIEISDFPFPINLIENGHYYGEVIVTLVNLPMLSEANGAEYCQSNLEVRFGTYEDIKSRAGRTIRNSIGLRDSENLLKENFYASQYKKGNEGTFARERTLIKYGDKYQPIKKYAISLEEMTPTNKDNYLTPPKKWYLQVEGLFRDYIVRQATKDGVELSQDFCLIITIRDNKRRHDVYNITTNLLDVNGFIHSNINLKNQVAVRVGGR